MKAIRKRKQEDPVIKSFGRIYQPSGTMDTPIKATKNSAYRRTELKPLLYCMNLINIISFCVVVAAIVVFAVVIVVGPAPVFSHAFFGAPFYSRENDP